jgi:glycosyltransferase involved in cell wall biosynthesis
LRLHGSGYDVIHVHNYAAFPALAAAYATDRPLIFTPYYHGIGHTPAAKALHVPYDWFAKRIFTRSAYILCVSNAEVNLVIRDHPVVASRVSNVGIGIDGEAVLGGTPFQVNRPVVLLMGRLEAYKQIERAIQAFAICNSDADMVIIGTGPERDRIRARVDELEIGNRVQMLGYVNDAEVRRWQRTAKVMMSLSIAESFGLGVAEAALAGARVVASDIPAHREVAAMAGDAFDFVPPGALAADVATVLRRALSAPSVRGHGCTFPTWPEVSERTLDFYNMAISRLPD